MQHRKILYATIVLATVSLIYFLAPEEKLEKLGWQVRSLAKPRVIECVRIWESRFDNPDSLIVIDDSESQEGDRRKLTVKYKAKNVYGAYVRNTLTCGLDSSGSIDIAETYKYIDNPYYILGVEEAPAAEPPSVEGLSVDVPAAEAPSVEDIAVEAPAAEPPDKH